MDKLTKTDIEDSVSAILKNTKKSARKANRITKEELNSLGDVAGDVGDTVAGKAGFISKKKAAGLVAVALAVPFVILLTPLAILLATSVVDVVAREKLGHEE